MRFAKFQSKDTVRFCRIKRRGTKNCRVVWLDTNHEELMPLSAVTECSAIEAGAVPPTEPSSPSSSESPSPLSADEVCRLMRSYQVTSREMAERLSVPLDQVRLARAHGIADPDQVLAWLVAMQGEPAEVAG